MKINGKGLNLQVLAECLCYLLFGVLLFCLTCSGRYLNYVTPRMKPYLYGLSLLMFFWAVAQGRYVLTPQYRVRLSRSVVFLIPVLLIAATPAAPGGGRMIQNYDGLSISAGGGVNGGTAGGTGQGSSSGQDGPQDFFSGEDGPRYDLNGLDNDTKTITIADEDYYTWIYEFSSYPEKYEGYTIVMKGFVYRDEEIKKKCDFALVRLSMWCCAADLTPLGLLVDWDGTMDFKDDDWVVVKGTLGVTEDGASLILKAQSVEAAKKPQEEYVYPYF